MTFKRPAAAIVTLQAKDIKKVQQRVVKEVIQWKKDHEGCMPSQYSDDATEKKLYRAFQKLPAEIRTGLRSTVKETHWRLVIQKYLDFIEEHDSLPVETLGSPGYEIAKAYRKLRTKMKKHATGRQNKRIVSKRLLKEVTSEETKALHEQLEAMTQRSNFHMRSAASLKKKAEVLEKTKDHWRNRVAAIDNKLQKVEEELKSLGQENRLLKKHQRKCCACQSRQ